MGEPSDEVLNAYGEWLATDPEFRRYSGAIDAAFERESALRAECDLLRSQRDEAVNALKQIQQWGAPFDAHGTHADRVRALVVATLKSVSEGGTP